MSNGPTKGALAKLAEAVGDAVLPRIEMEKKIREVLPTAREKYMLAIDLGLPKKEAQSFRHITKIHWALDALTARQEARIEAGQPWTMDKVPGEKLNTMLGAISGFELEVRAWRPTFKLSQNKPLGEGQRAADGLEAEGSTAIAELMRAFAQNEPAHKGAP